MGIFANGVISFALENPTFPIPPINRKFYEECIKGIKGSKRCNMPLISHFVLTEWKGVWDHKKDTKGWSAPIQTLAEKLRINAEVHLWYHFEQRQFQALRVQTQSSKKAHELQRLINQRKDGSKLDQEDQDLIKIHQDILFQSDKKVKSVGETWLKKNTSNVLVYYKYLLSIQEQGLQTKDGLGKEEVKGMSRVKTFSYLPIPGYQKSSIEIQSKDLAIFYRRMGWKVPPQNDFLQQKDLQWKKLLNIPFKKGPWSFNNSIVTDGVQCSIIMRKETNVPKSTKSQSDLIDLTKVERGLFTDKQIQPLPNHTFTIVGIDPGRNKLLSCSNGTGLSKKQYYDECGFNTTLKRREHYLENQSETVKTLIHQAANQTFRVSRFKDWKSNWEARRPLEKTLFKFYGDKRFRNHKFYTYRRRQQCLDRAFNRIEAGLPRKNLVIAFGNGKFPTSSKGEKGGPLVLLARRLATRLKVVYTDEYKTSKTCSHCHGPSNHPLVKGWKCINLDDKKSPRKYELVIESRHEILQCKNCSVWYDRDLNASYLIRDLLDGVLKGQTRPLPLKRSRKEFEFDSTSNPSSRTYILRPRVRLNSGSGL